MDAHTCGQAKITQNKAACLKKNTLFEELTSRKITIKSG